MADLIYSPDGRPEPETSALAVVEADPVQVAINRWLEAKSGRSGSAKTKQAYSDAIVEFRETLKRERLDLDSDPNRVADVAERWASKPRQTRADEQPITASTFNQRIAIISSFYSYAEKHHLHDLNPIRQVERRPVQSYANAVPLDAANVSRRLKAIDRSDMAGKRDYALLLVALTTGRRLSELVGLKIGDVARMDKRVTLTFRRAKGGKVMRDTLAADVAKALLDYLASAYNKKLADLSIDAPVWVSLHHAAKSKPLVERGLSLRAVSDICKARLGVSKVHALRHTFAHELEGAGAKVSDIQARLGHSNLATTGRYLAALNSADNPYADELAKLFGA